MTTLRPIEIQPEQPKEIQISEPVSEAQMDPKNVEFLAYLGLKDEMFNSKVMEKIQYLTERLTLEDLEELTIRFASDGHLSKLDKILLHLKLSEKEDEYKLRLNLINAQKNAI